MEPGLYTEAENYTYSDPRPTFVYYSSDKNGDVMIGLRQWRNDSLQGFHDIYLNSLQFANLLFQMKALERQFMEAMLVTNKNTIVPVNWDEFLIQQPPAMTHEEAPVTKVMTTTAASAAPAAGGAAAVDNVVEEVRSKSVKRKRKKKPTAAMVETITIDDGDTQFVDFTKHF